MRIDVEFVDDGGDGAHGQAARERVAARDRLPEGGAGAGPRPRQRAQLADDGGYPHTRRAMSQSPRVVVLHRPGLAYAVAVALRRAEPRLRGRRGPLQKPRPRPRPRRHPGVEPARRPHRARGTAWSSSRTSSPPRTCTRRSPARSHRRLERHARLAPPRPVLDYALRAAGPRGQVRVVDAPVEGCEIREGRRPARHLRRHRAPPAAQGHDVGFLDMRHFRVAPVFALDDVRRLGRSWNLGLLVRRRPRRRPARLPRHRPRRSRAASPTPTPLRLAGPALPPQPLAGPRSEHHTGGHHEYSAPGRPCSTPTW